MAQCQQNRGHTKVVHVIVDTIELGLHHGVTVVAPRQGISASPDDFERVILIQI